MHIHDWRKKKNKGLEEGKDNYVDVESILQRAKDYIKYSSNDDWIEWS